MVRRGFLLGSVVFAGTRPVRADAPWSLLTEAELERERAAPRAETPKRTLTTRGLSGVPAIRIVVVTPTVDRPLRAPLSFQVKFETEPGVTVDPRSFHAAYGFLGIDITARLLEHARLTAKGLEAENVAIPAGEHRVTLAIGDGNGHQTSETFSFTVT